MDSTRSLRYPQLGILLAALVLLGIFGMAFQTVRSFQAASDSVQHTQEMRVKLGETLSHLKDVHLHTRAYLIGGDERLLPARQQSQADYAAGMAALQLTARHPAQREALGRLDALARQLSAEYDNFIALRRSGGMAAVTARAAEGEVKRLADEIKNVTTALQADEAQRLSGHLAGVRRESSLTLTMLAVGLLLDVMLVIAVVVVLRRNFRALAGVTTALRQQAEEIKQAHAYSESIVDTVREPLVILTHDLRLNSANRAFHETFRTSPAELAGRPFREIGGGVWAIPALEAALSGIIAQQNELTAFEVAREFPGLGPRVMLLNARQLHRAGDPATMLLVALEDITERKRAEARLQTRSAELEAANRELEAFSYSVSHDLRAPLRHIDYFSMTLKKHLAKEQLDAKAQHYLASISSSARDMGRLIDDLLSLARLSRTELRHSRVRLDEIVEETRDALQTEINGRTIAWEISPLPEVEGDPALLRQVFANLLSNAVKYTRRRAEARIEISAQPGAAGEQIVRVRDNGAGFDMKYAEKLFGVFQRLHAAHEFEGNGVGLANVRRIVERHGGRIWAEAAVDRGATFYFSLPRSPHNN